LAHRRSFIASEWPKNGRGIAQAFSRQTQG
jgi:hypothetical protein